MLGIRQFINNNQYKRIIKASELILYTTEMHASEQGTKT
jgi:hypothetical protein